MQNMPDISAMFGMPPELWDMIRQSSAERQRLQPQADDAWGQLQTAMQAPEPSIDPSSEFLTNLAGNVSQAIAPSMNGQATARAAIENKRNDMRTRQLKTLQALQMNYERLGKQAEAAGDHERAAKMYALQLKQTEKENDLRMAHDRQMQVDSQTFQSGQTDKTIAAQKAMNDADNAAANYRAMLGLQESLARVGRDKEGNPILVGMNPTEFIKARSGLTKLIAEGKAKPEQLPSLLAELHSNLLQNEVQNPAAYAQRLLGVTTRTGGILGSGYGAEDKPVFLPQQIFDKVANIWQVDFNDPDQVKDLLAHMRKAGMTPAQLASLKYPKAE